MSLLKLTNQCSESYREWAQNEARRLIQAISNQDLILEAYLFGSAVDGDFNENSDLDILVVTSDESAIKELQKQVYSPRFANIAVDWIFKTKSSFDERKNLGGVCFVAIREGIRLK